MIGNNNEPGVSSTVRSAPSVNTSGPSIGTPLLIAPANLSSGNANPNEVYGIGGASEAQQLFGSDSDLTNGVTNALRMGAQPVLAIAPEETTESKDLSGLSGTSGSLDLPLKEDSESITVTIDSTDQTVSWTLDDPSSHTPNSDEVLVNPTTDTFELDSAPSSSGTFEYTSVDYTAAIETAVQYTGNVDFLGARKERSDVTTQVVGAANQMETEESFVLALAGLPTPVDADQLTVDYDTSRLQLFPSVRMQDRSSILPSLLGLRGQLGLTTTPINQQIPLSDRPYQGLDATERATLIEKNVTPLERIGESVRVADDITTVSNENAEEQNYKYGFSRLVVDFLIETVHTLEKPFVGKFNSPGAIGQLEDLLNKEARPLSNSNVIYDYEASVELISPTKARVTFRADVAEPIRFIENDFVIGQNLEIQNSV
jgi:hypothetical protein